LLIMIKKCGFNDSVAHPKSQNIQKVHEYGILRYDKHLCMNVKKPCVCNQNFYFRYQKSKVKHHFLYKILIRKILIAEVFFTLECLKGGYICYGAVLYRLLENYLVGKKVRY